MTDVLIFSARMGAGHDGAANELARRARERGRTAQVVDFLDAFPRLLGRSWERFYFLQLRRWPESYERSYQQFYRHPALWAPFVQFERILAGNRCLQWIDAARPDVIVSTYSFATLVLGRLREEGRIQVPTVAFLTDFGVHPRTVHPAIDLHLAVHQVAADDARRFVPGRVDVTGPAVHPAYAADDATRTALRLGLGLAPEARMVLLVCGSWGIGANLPMIAAALAASDDLAVVVACGRDRHLRSIIENTPQCTALGWTDEMPSYMAAADVVVENAGGLSSLEALASGVPIVSFDPIPGHGRDNVRAMTRAGITSAPESLEDLVTIVSRLSRDTPERRRQLAAVEGMFTRNPIDPILDLIGTTSRM